MMIEEILINYLSSKIDVETYLERPIDCPESYILIEKIGSDDEKHGLLHRATIAVQSHAKTMYQTATLNERVKEIMNALPIHVSDVCLCELDSDYNFTNTKLKGYRYQAIFDITYY